MLSDVYVDTFFYKTAWENGRMFQIKPINFYFQYTFAFIFYNSCLGLISASR